MLSLIHNIRVDRIRRNYDHSFKKNLNNYSNSELTSGYQVEEPLDNKMPSSTWINIYRKTVI